MTTDTTSRQFVSGTATAMRDRRRHRLVRDTTWDYRTEITETAEGRWRWKIVTSQRVVLVVGPRDHRSKRAARHAAGRAVWRLRSHSADALLNSTPYVNADPRRRR